MQTIQKQLSITDNSKNNLVHDIWSFSYIAFIIQFTTIWSLLALPRWQFQIFFSGLFILMSFLKRTISICCGLWSFTLDIIVSMIISLVQNSWIKICEGTPSQWSLPFCTQVHLRNNPNYSLSLPGTIDKQFKTNPRNNSQVQFISCVLGYLVEDD